MKTALLPVVLLLAGCSSLPGFDDPRVSLAPHVVILDIEYDSSMQSRNSGGMIQNNPSMNEDVFGNNDRKTQIGGTLRIGDGFSGVEFSYLHFEMSTSKQGRLTSDWGIMQAGDPVNTEVEGNEFRFRYIAQLYEHSFETDYEDVRVQVGLGPGLAHREVDFTVTHSALSRRQKVDPKDDGVVYIASRARASYDLFALTADFQISPDLTFGGDFEGTMWDLELIGSYTFEDQDLTAFVGWRRSEMESSGRQGDFEYDLDLTFDGYVLGVEFTF